ncbi:LysR family transcriptional regulator [Endozoicomonas atrinae]|uniref:LysR family transcriptional regulator n=1 Tax=Endozoicomonas atrinae TaxID=1333660 RepID=UPI000826C0F7|nr:LysR family transcriptional regulator [Endozoicomonas atrinae]
MITKTDTPLDLNLLSVFLEVYRLRSITLAADALEMTQPGVSGVLKRLQQQLGAELFVREGRGISPTHIAVQLASEISPALNDVSNAISNIKQFDPQQPRVFRVLCNEMALLHFHPRIEHDKTLGNVSIEFVIAPSNEDDMLQELSLQKADLALDITGQLSPSYKSHPVIQDEIVIVARKDHPRIHQTLTEQQYYQEKHVTMRIRRANIYAADYFTKTPLKPRKISAECDSLMSMLALVSSSDSIGSTSRSLASRYAPLFNLQVIEQPFETLPIEHVMIWHSRTDYSPAHQWLREKIQNHTGQ